MRREAPDTHFYAEIRDLNLEFLGLIAAGKQCCHGPVFGLDAAIVEQISRFSRAELETMAATPCLLAGFGGGRGARPARIAEPSPSSDAQWVGHARLFAAGLLTYVLQMAGRDPLRAALCAGSTAGAPACGTAYRDICAGADRALERLEARFRRQTRFWPDLIRATRDGHPERLQLARLSAIQLATFEAGRRPAVARIEPVLAAETAGTR
jgi:hypothetical protein